MPPKAGQQADRQERVEAAGLVVQGAKPVRRNAAGVDVVRHRTAIIRRDLSQPVQILISHGIISTNSTVLDDGCGQGHDVTALTANGYQASGWDPHYAPDGPGQTADVGNLGLVLNVIEDRHERAETLTAAYGFAQRALSISVMPLGKYTFDGLRPYGDGYVTTRGTFQKNFAQQELRNFIAHTLGEAPVAFAPGIFVVFRDKDLEQEVLLKRQSRDIIRPLVWQAPERRRQEIAARPALIERIRAGLEMLWTAMAERGRILDIEEFPDTRRPARACWLRRRAAWGHRGRRLHRHQTGRAPCHLHCVRGCDGPFADLFRAYPRRSGAPEGLDGSTRGHDSLPEGPLPAG